MADPIIVCLETTGEPICPWCLAPQPNYPLTEFFQCENPECGKKIELSTLNDGVRPVIFITRPVYEEPEE